MGGELRERRARMALDEPRDVQRVQTVNADQENVPDARIAQSPASGPTAWALDAAPRASSKVIADSRNFMALFLYVRWKKKAMLTPSRFTFVIESLKLRKVSCVAGNFRAGRSCSQNLWIACGSLDRSPQAFCEKCRVRTHCSNLMRDPANCRLEATMGC